MFESMSKDKESGTLKMGLLFFKFSHYFKVYKDYLVNFELALVRRGTACHEIVKRCLYALLQ
jgi:hypothetical protein